MNQIKKIERRLENFIASNLSIRRCKKKQRKNIGAIKENAIYHNMYKGKRCFILGTGPSLNEMDLSLLKNEYVFTVNMLPKNKQFDSLHSNFHMWSDNRFFNINEDDAGDMMLLETMKKVRSQDNNPVVFYELSAKSMVEKYGLDKVLDIHYFSTTYMDLDYRLEKGLVRFDRVIPDFPTVVQISICLAVYMGFSEIILLGVDCTGFITIAQSKLNEYRSDSYAFDISEAEKKRIIRNNNFYSISKELKNYALIFDTYEKLKYYANKYGAHILNATPRGLLECVEKVDYKSLFETK